MDGGYFDVNHVRKVLNIERIISLHVHIGKAKLTGV